MQRLRKRKLNSVFKVLLNLFEVRAKFSILLHIVAIIAYTIFVCMPILQSLIFSSAYDHMFTICSGLSQIFGDEK